MLILGIESSCDDTSVALLDCSPKGCFIIAEKTASQIEIHKKYGGVVPEIAGRMHAEKIVPLVEEVCLYLTLPSPYKGEEKTRLSLSPSVYKGGIKPDVIAVTAGPGLITGLIVGVEAARTLSYVWDVPLVAVNHIEGHIHSVEIPNQKFQIPNKFQKFKSKKNNNGTMEQWNNEIEYPALALVVSGGHTELIYMKKQGSYNIIGKTRDDAAGECFDKVAKLLGLPYPGGPQISKLAVTGNPKAINFPRPMMKDDNFDFSFAGLKTSALYWLRDNTGGTCDFGLATLDLSDFCASFEQAIVDVLISKTIRAAEQYKPKSVILAGGVSANSKLRSSLSMEVNNLAPNSEPASSAGGLRTPNSEYCMDNAAMIAVAGYYHALKEDFTSWKKIKADPNWELA